MGITASSERQRLSDDSAVRARSEQRWLTLLLLAQRENHPVNPFGCATRPEMVPALIVLEQPRRAHHYPSILSSIASWPGPGLSIALWLREGICPVHRLIPSVLALAKTGGGGGEGLLAGRLSSHSPASPWRCEGVHRAHRPVLSFSAPPLPVASHSSPRQRRPPPDRSRGGRRFFARRSISSSRA